MPRAKTVEVRLTAWEIGRVVVRMEEGPQEDCDRDLMIKLWDCQRQFASRRRKK